MFLRLSGSCIAIKAAMQRHVITSTALSIIVLAVMIFGVLNSQWLTAQLRYRTTQPTQAVSAAVDMSNKTDPSSPATLMIPAIQVQAPIILDEPSESDDKVQLALRHGVLLYGQSAKPGESGNTVIVGHSSGRVWAPGDYKWIFTLLEKLKTGDKIIVNYQGRTYTYTVQDRKVVSPNDLSALSLTKEPTLSLVTCTPVGTNKNRLIIRASLDS